MRSPLPPTMSPYWFHSSRSGVLTVILRFVGSFGANFASDKIIIMRMNPDSM